MRIAGSIRHNIIIRRALKDISCFAVWLFKKKIRAVFKVMTSHVVQGPWSPQARFGRC